MFGGVSERFCEHLVSGDLDSLGERIDAGVEVQRNRDSYVTTLGERGSAVGDRDG